MTSRPVPAADPAGEIRDKKDRRGINRVDKSFGGLKVHGGVVFIDLYGRPFFLKRY